MSKELVFQRPDSPRNIKGRWIILREGSFITLREWQAINGFKPNQVGRYFSTDEKAFSGKDWCMSELTIKVADLWRSLSQKPKKVNSFYRTNEKQEKLKKQGYRAASVSPHEFGLALDIDTTTKAETYKEVKILKEAAKELNVAIRIGYEKYLKDGMTFIHFDTCPEYFRPGKVWEFIEHSNFWELENRW